MNCDQCHLDRGVKTKSGGITTTTSHEATWVVSVNGAKLNLCDTHKVKFDRATSKKDYLKYTAREI